MGRMSILLIVLTSILFIILLLVGGMRPAPNLVSIAELERRSKKGDKEAKQALRREKLLADVIALLEIKSAFLWVAFALLSVVTFDWLIGAIVASLGALFYGLISRGTGMGQMSQALYELLEPKLLKVAKKIKPFIRLIRPLARIDVNQYRRFDSREDLQELIDRAETVLSDNERALLVHSLEFSHKKIETVMVPRSDIVTIKKTEFLGPLVLSELHDLGHSFLPVISKDVDHVIGILNLSNLLSLDIKRSVTAEKAMDPEPAYILDTDTLEDGLAMLLKAHQPLLIVTNEHKETVGLVTLSDIIEALVGRKLSEKDDNPL